MRQAQNVGGATHIFLHVAHEVARFQIEAAGIIANALADQCDQRTLRTPRHINDTWVPSRCCCLTDRLDRRKSVLNRLPDRDVARRTMQGGQIGGGLRQFSRTHQVGWLVDQVTDKPNTVCNRQCLRPQTLVSDHQNTRLFG